MGVKAWFITQFAKVVHSQMNTYISNSVYCQDQVFRQLIEVGRGTSFGVDHHFDEISTYESYKRNVPIRDYEGMRLYIERILDGEPNVLWKGKPAFFAKTSGTTSGAKFIPITKDSIPNHFGSARNAVFSYLVKEGRSDFLDGKMIFLSGSPKLDTNGEFKVGRLSGISNHLIPAWLRSNQLPTYSINCIEDWEEKVAAIVDQTHQEDIRLIGGIPPWVQMYFELLLQKTGKKNIVEVFPNLSVFVHGGVNYSPYKSTIEQLIGKEITTIETFPASEGFIAYQDLQSDDGLLLNINSGIFFEFITPDDLLKGIDSRLTLKDVELGVNYAILITSNAGLWSYNIGDTIEFVSLSPYRIRVTGRIKHFISAFGEHIIAKEVESALLKATQHFKLLINEFTVAPYVASNTSEASRHEWFIEWKVKPTISLTQIEQVIEASLMEQNSYYKDLIEGAILKPLKIVSIREGGMRAFMRSNGKLGGQNKMIRLSNDRKIADFLIQNAWVETTEL